MVNRFDTIFLNRDILTIFILLQTHLKLIEIKKVKKKEVKKIVSRRQTCLHLDKLKFSL